MDRGSVIAQEGLVWSVLMPCLREVPYWPVCFQGPQSPRSLSQIDLLVSRRGIRL